MSRLYYTLRRGLKLALELYFVDIQSSGTSHIPAEGPVLFAANHPNSIMDTMLLGACTSRQVHYMARSGLFKNPVVAWLFDACGVIPVYRAQDGIDMSQNQSSFTRAYEVLERGDALGIFPEGQNSQERRVLQIKTGAARITLEAEARHGFLLGTQIVPVGITFQDRDRFMTSVLVRFGPPIPLREYEQAYRHDERETVRALTRDIQQALETQVLHIEHDLVLELTRTLLQISAGELLSTLREEDEAFKARITERIKHRRGLSKGLLDKLRFARRTPKLVEEFGMERTLGEALSWELLHKPRDFAKRRASLRAYQDHLAQTRLRHDFAQRHPVTLSSRKEGIKLTLYAVLVGPLAAWGFVHNVVPYQLSYTAAMRAPDEAIRAMTAFMVGMVSFGIWYGLLGWVFWHSAGLKLLTALYLVSLPITGFLFLRYRHRVATWRARILARTLFRSESNLVETLLRERERLLESALALLSEHAALNTSTGEALVTPSEDPSP